MKKQLSLCLLMVLVIVLVLSIWRSSTAPYVLRREGIAPYQLSARESQLMTAMGRGDTTLLSYHTPDNTMTMWIRVYDLDAENNEWDCVRSWPIHYAYYYRECDVSDVRGTLSITWGRDGSLQIIELYSEDENLIGTCTADPIAPDFSPIAWGSLDLSQFQKITWDVEIPVSMQVYDTGGGAKSYTLEDFFTPERLTQEPAATVARAITITFSDQLIYDYLSVDSE